VRASTSSTFASLASANGRKLAGAERPDPRFHGDGRQARPEKLLASRQVASSPVTSSTGQPRCRRAQRCARLADKRVVEPQVLPLLARDRVRHHAVGRPGAGVRADKQRRVAALLEEVGVLRPEGLHASLRRWFGGLVLSVGNGFGHGDAPDGPDGRDQQHDRVAGDDRRGREIEGVATPKYSCDGACDRGP
jgi:hypothetical protein